MQKRGPTGPRVLRSEGDGKNASHGTQASSAQPKTKPSSAANTGSAGNVEGDEFQIEEETTCMQHVGAESGLPKGHPEDPGSEVHEQTVGTESDLLWGKLGEPNANTNAPVTRAEWEMFYGRKGGMAVQYGECVRLLGKPLVWKRIWVLAFSYNIQRSATLPRKTKQNPLQFHHRHHPQQYATLCIPQIKSVSPLLIVPLPLGTSYATSRLAKASPPKEMAPTTPILNA
jgi:hypothetical protein